jgi:TPR repeat protein
MVGVPDLRKLWPGTSQNEVRNKMAYSDMSVDVAPEFGLSAETATGEELYKVGLVYSEGVDCERDLIAAHQWFNLAVLKGHDDAKICREEMADLLDKEDIKSALKAARAWLMLAN